MSSSDKVCYRLFEKRGLLHAQSFGATHLGALMFVAQHAPTGRAATAQGYLAIAAGLAMAAATGISGVLYADFGSREYRDGASGGRWRRLRIRSAADSARADVLTAPAPARRDRSSPRCR